MNKTVNAIGFTEDMVNISQLFTLQNQNKKQVENEGREIVDQMRNNLLSDFQRKTIDGSLGRWFCVKKQRAAYFALAHQIYPERLAYQMLNVN